MTTEAIRLLLVEDDPAYARLVQERLRERYELQVVAVAPSLAEGIAAASAHAPQVVMLDLALPDSEGVATIIAFHAAHPRLPVVVLTGLDNIDLSLEAMRHGAQEYLVKGQAEAQLFPRAARSAIERKRLQELEQLLIGVVSHDLRGPLQIVTLNCELAAPETTGAVRGRIERALGAARHAETLVNDLLDATRARLGGLLPIDPAPVDLVRLVEHAVHDLRAGADAEIAVDAPATLIARVDGPRFTQVINNLVGNAIQHSTLGTPIRVWLRDEAGALELGVHNLGDPVPDELRRKLFEPLERARLPSHNHSIGLGLYIVHEIIKAHGGSIDVTSTAEAGTTFRVRLPH